jgi:hypothetical protein
VELQEFSPVQYFSHLGYDNAPEPLIVDKRGEAAQRMRDHLDLDTLNLHPTAAEMAAADGREKFRIGLFQTYAQISAFDDAEEAVERVRSYLSIATDFLKPKVERITLRTFVVAPTSSFEDLRDVLNRRLLGGVDKAREALGADISDSSWVLESESQDTTRRLQFGPMRDSQLQGMLEMTERFGPPEMLFLLTESRSTLAIDDSEILGAWAKLWDAHEKFTARTSDWLAAEAG